MSTPANKAGWRDGRTGVVVAMWLLVLVKIGVMVDGRGSEWWRYDLRVLWRDQQVFYARVYPHAAIAPQASVVAGEDVRSAYPPTSFPLFTPWLPPVWKWRVTRVWFNSWQLVALGALLWFVWTRTREVSARLSALLAGTVLAISGTRADLLYGNMGSITTALLLGALVALERGRPAVAAAAWLSAMVKPQMGWLFAVEFWRRKTWRAWLAAALLLGASGVAACIWTGVTLAAAFGVEAGEEASKWGAWSPLNNLPVWLGAWGLSPHAALVTGAAIGLAVTAWAMTRPALREDLLGRFAVLGLVNRICVYHNYCDDLLLVFALLWIGLRAWRGAWPAWAMWLLLAATVVTPTTVTVAAGLKGLVILVWAGAVVWMLRQAEKRAAI